MRLGWIAAASVFASLSGAWANDIDAAMAAAKAHHAENGPEILGQFAELLKIPNHALDTENIEKNADVIKDLFAKRGFEMSLLTSDEAPPLIYGRRDAPGADRTIAIYVHYDGQPVAPEEWTHPPFEPVLYSRSLDAGGDPIDFPKSGEPLDPEWRLYARSAGDDKAPIPALLAALDALDGENIPFTSNIVLIFDGEEENSSGHLDDYLAQHSDLFGDVDLWLFCDGPMHQSGTPQLVFGVRGVISLDVTVYGPDRGLHSGHYGNWAPGPGWRLTELLASMKTGDGRVKIKDFYKSTIPLTRAERAAIAAAPDVDSQLRQSFALAQTEADNAPLGERISLPALNLQGLRMADVEDAARNVIPPSATATIGLRLVRGNDPAGMLDLVEAHIKRQGYHIVREAPDRETRLAHPLIAKVTRGTGYRAVKSDMADPRVASLVSALKVATDDALILTPTLGGSLPLYMFETVSDAPIVILPIANYDNNQHAADENIRIGNLLFGIEAYAAVLTME